MMQKFCDAGYKICDVEDGPDIYIVNTCTVTNIADRKSRQSLRKVKDNKKTIVIAVRMLCTSCKRHFRADARNRYSIGK